MGEVLRSRSSQIIGEKTVEQVHIASGVDGLLAKAQPQKWQQKVRKMRVDPTIAFLRDMYSAPILGAEWTVVSDSDKYKDAEQLIFASTVKHRETFLDNAVRGLLDFGWQSYEVVLNYSRKRNLYVRKYKPLLQDLTYLLVNERGQLVGCRNMPFTLTTNHRFGVISKLNTNHDNGDRLRTEWPWVDLLGPEQITVYREVEGTNWYGEAVMARVEGPYDWWNDVNESSNRYSKKIAGSHWVVYYPPGKTLFEGIDTDNYTIAKSILNSVESSGRIAVPQVIAQWVDDLNSLDQSKMAWRVELISASSSVSDFVEKQRYLDSLKSRGVGLPERAVLEGQFGTKAEAEAHADFAISNLERAHSNIVRILNEKIVKFLLKLNFGDDYVGKVYLQVMPLSDSKREIIRTIYSDYFRTEDGQSEEIDAVDWPAIRDMLGVPTVK